MDTQTEFKKPKVKLSGTNGNVFALGQKCISALEAVGQGERAIEMRGKIMRSKSYSEALDVMADYCKIS